MNKASKQKRQREQGFPVQDIQYQELNFNSNENPIHNTATWSSLDDQNSNSQRLWSPAPDIDQITSDLYECHDEISMNQYLRSPLPVDDRAEGNAFATFSGAYPRSTEDATFSGAYARSTEDATFSGASARSAEAATFSGAYARSAEDATFSGAYTRSAEDATFSGACARTTEDSIFPHSRAVGLAESHDSRESSPQTEDELTPFGASPTLSDREIFTKDGRRRQRAPKKYRADFLTEEDYQAYKRHMDKERQQKRRDKEKKKKEAMNAGLLFQPRN